jgi:hypothetical protein
MRFLLFVLLSAFYMVSPPSAAQTSMCANEDETFTSDPNHPGCVGENVPQQQPARISWSKYSTDCPTCEALVKTYNDVVIARFRLSYQIALIDYEVNAAKRGEGPHGLRVRDPNPNRPDGSGLTQTDEAVQAYKLALSMSATTMSQEVKPGLIVRERALRKYADNLRSQIRECERQCEQKEEEENGTKTAIGGNSQLLVDLPFPWRGPYPPVCTRCEKLAQRLNELPKLYTMEKTGFDVASANEALAEAEIRRYR